MEEKKEMELVRRILDYAGRYDLDMDYYPGCAEYGYDDKPVIAANWNGPSIQGSWDYRYDNGKQKLTEHGKQRLKLSKLSILIDKFEHVSLEWSDEWSRCDDCGKAVRTSPSSYGWSPSWAWVSDYEMVCHECYKDNIDDIVDHYLSEAKYGFKNRALHSDFIPFLEDLGFTCWQERDGCKIYETGFHRGQNDDPKKVYDEIIKDSKDWEIIFVITDTGQFDIHWTAYVRKEIEE